MAHIVDGIERELVRIELWEEQPPSPRRVASPQPFCFDTLCFHQWLQWLFLPRMRRIIRNDGALPAQSAIAPYAEDCLCGAKHDPSRLLFLIRTFDELISEDTGAGALH